MYKIQTLSKISSRGLDVFSHEGYEVASEIPGPDAILVRSTDMLDRECPDTLKAIARAGIGVNNIPVDRCSGKGVVVFNTPGANANGVKELVLAGMLISSRRVVDGIHWTRELKSHGDDVPQLVEKGKSRFAGPEIKGKRLGVIGLGAIGVLVANDAVALGMEVMGFDPFISVESAWGLRREVRRAKVLESLIAECDYITLHVPLVEQTRGMIDKQRFSLMKKGLRLLNFARGGLVNNRDLQEAVAQGIVTHYITDFPDSDLLEMEEVIAIPHLGASTPESEDNCAVMAANQIMNYLENGNIRNSVNFPECDMGAVNSVARLIIANRNIPNMVGQITTLLANAGLNISDMLNRHRGDLAFNIIDVEAVPGDDLMTQLKSIDGVVMARVLKPNGSH